MCGSPETGARTRKFGLSPTSLARCQPATYYQNQVEGRARGSMAEELLQVGVLILVLFDHNMNSVCKGSVGEIVERICLER